MLGRMQAAPLVIYWPDGIRNIVRTVVRSAREIWHGLDSWNAVTHGVVPLSGAAQEQLAVRGDVEGLAALADAGDEYAAELLARLHAERSEGQ